jgi:peroxiredoxin/outer membrane lipoprotein-sorting protein
MACMRMIWLTALTGGWLFVQAQTATQILDQTTKAYAQLQSLRLEVRSEMSTVVVGPGGEMRFTQKVTQQALAMRPNYIRMTARYDQQGFIEGEMGIFCDGKDLYMQNPSFQQTLKKAAPKTLRDIYTDENLQQANYTMAGLDPIYLMAYGDWRKMAGQPRLAKREKLGNRPVYKLSVPIKVPQRLQSALGTGARTSAYQVLWIGVQDRLIWQSQVVMNLSQGDLRISMRITERYARQERNPRLQPTAFAYKPPKGFEIVSEFKMPDFGGETSALRGQPAPEFALNDLQGKQVRLADYKGKIVVLNVFAHWCGPCRKEAPELEKDLWQAYKARDVVVLGVATWAQDNPTKRAEEFAREFKLTFPVLVDAENKVAEMYRVRGVPTTFIIDREGVVREFVVGADVAGIKRAVESLLNTPPAAPTEDKTSEGQR